MRGHHDNGKTINEVREDIGLPETALTHKMVTRNRQVVNLELKVDTTQFDESIERAIEQLQSIRDELAHPAAVFPSTLHPLSRFIPPTFEASDEYVEAPTDNTTPWIPHPDHTHAPEFMTWRSEDIFALSAERDAALADAEMKQGTIDLMNRGLQSWQADYDELQGRYDSLHVCYDEQIDARSRLQESHRTLCVENEQLRDLRDELQGTIDLLAQRNAELLTECQALRTKHQDMINELRWNNRLST